MKRFLVPIAALAAIAALAVGLSSALAATRTVNLASASSPLGRLLTDGHGHTLYLFEKDTRGKSTCSGQCARFWPPLIVSGKPHATAGAKTSLLGTTSRADGRLQATYNHHPLYTFFKDTKKGQTNGEGVNFFGAEWYVLSLTGAKIEKSDTPQNAGNGTSADSNTTTTPAYGGYGR